TPPHTTSTTHHHLHTPSHTSTHHYTTSTHHYTTSTPHHTPPHPTTHHYTTSTPHHTPRNNMTFLQRFIDIQYFGFISQFFAFRFTEVYVHILILNVSAISTVLLLHCSAWFGKLALEGSHHWK